MRIRTNVYLQSLNYNASQKFKLKKTRLLTDHELKKVNESFTASQIWRLRPMHNRSYGLLDVATGNFLVADKFSDESRFSWFKFEPVARGVYKIKMNDDLCLGIKNSKRSIYELGCSNSSSQRFRVHTYEFKGKLYVAIEPERKPGYVWDADVVISRGPASLVRRNVNLAKNKLTDTQLFWLQGPYQ